MIHDILIILRLPYSEPAIDDQPGPRSRQGSLTAKKYSTSLENITCVYARLCVRACVTGGHLHHAIQRLWAFVNGALSL